jgi:hypothetical protein
VGTGVIASGGNGGDAREILATVRRHPHGALPCGGCAIAELIRRSYAIYGGPP